MEPQNHLPGNSWDPQETPKVSPRDIRASPRGPERSSRSLQGCQPTATDAQGPPKMAEDHQRIFENPQQICTDPQLPPLERAKDLQNTKKVIKEGHMSKYVTASSTLKMCLRLLANKKGTKQH